MHVLAYPKFRLAAGEREELLADYLPYAEVWTAATVTGTPVCRDLADQMFIDLAHSANAQALVNGDEDLLSLRAQGPRFGIVSVADFLKRFP